MSPRRALAAAALAALLALTVAQQPQQCAQDLKGSEVGRLVSLSDVPMPAGIRDPPVPPVAPGACPSGTMHVGTRLRACDYDVSPYVKLIDVNNGEVHRNGDLARQGKIHVTLFCQDANL